MRGRRLREGAIVGGGQASLAAVGLGDAGVGVIGVWAVHAGEQAERQSSYSEKQQVDMKSTKGAARRGVNRLAAGSSEETGSSKGKWNCRGRAGVFWGDGAALEPRKLGQSRAEQSNAGAIVWGGTRKWRFLGWPSQVSVARRNEDHPLRIRGAELTHWAHRGSSRRQEPVCCA